MSTNKKYPINELTFIPGGVKVIIEYTDKKMETYPNIKHINKYFDKIKSEGIQKNVKQICFINETNEKIILYENLDNKNICYIPRNK